jgi:hypothetical protein
MLPVTQSIQHQIVGWLVNNELERMWKEAVLAQHDVIFWQLHEGTEEKQDSWCPSQDSNRAPSEYKTQVLLL